MAEQIYISDEIKNKYENSPFRIPLRNRQGVIIEFTLVDKDDFERVNKYRWFLHSGGYAQGTVEKKTTYLHQFVFKKPEKGNVIDHINQDKLNNENSNLREVSRSENSHNIKKKNNNRELTSQFKGIYWDKRDKKWISQCRSNKKTVNLGSFKTQEDAAKQYDIYTFKVFGKNANNNNLVEYKDTLDATIGDLIAKLSNKYDTPKNICFHKTHNKYYARKEYNKKIYKGSMRATIDEALKDLEKINKEIELLKQKEKEEHKQKEITRNNNGIPYIKVKDIEVLVDEDKWHELSQMSWSIRQDGYIINGKEGLMHRYIIEAKKNEIVDHINNVKHDNRNYNLRVASATLNSHNKSKKKNALSKYFGVSKNGKNWGSQITYNGVTYCLGTYKDEIDAAKAYNEKAIELYGENANLNVFN
jgi:hypothetical protein